MNVLPYAKNFYRQRQDLPAFRAGYTVLTLVLAGLLNAGAMAIVIAIQAGMALGVRGRAATDDWLRVSVSASLLLLSLAVSLYLHPHLPEIGAMRGLLRADVTLLRGLTVLLAHWIILHSATHTSFLSLGGKPRETRTFFLLCWTTAALCGLLIALSPVLLNADGALLLAILRMEVIPWAL